MDPHLSSFALLPLLPPPLLILDCLFPPPSPSSPPPPRSFSCSYVIPTATLYPGASLSLLSERFHRRRFLGTCRRRRVCPCIASSLPRRSPGTYRRAFYFFSGADPFAFARTLRFAAIYYAPRSFLCPSVPVRRLSSSLASQFFINDSNPSPSLPPLRASRTLSSNPLPSRASEHFSSLISHLYCTEKHSCFENVFSFNMEIVK